MYANKTISPEINNAAKHGERYSLLLLLALFALCLSGDHIFNKTDNFKLLILAVLSTIGCALPLMQSNKRTTALMIFAFGLYLLFPLSTLPALFINREYDFSSALTGWSSKIFLSVWLSLCCFLFANTENLIRTTFVLILPTLFVCFVGFMEALGLEPQLRFWLNPFERGLLNSVAHYSGPSVRAASTFGNVNYFAAYLIQLLPLFVALCINEFSHRSEKPKLIKILLVITLAVSVLSLIQTQTRAAIFATIIATIVFLMVYTIVFSNRLLKPALFVFLALIGCILITLFFYQELIARFVNLFTSQAWSARFMGWIAAWNSVKSAPMFGYGLNSSYSLFFNYVSPESRLEVGERSFNHVHNEWLEVMQEGGLFGLAIILAVYGYVTVLAVKLIRAQSQPQSVRVIVLGAICGILAFQLHGIFSVAQRMVLPNAIFTLLMGLILGTYYRHHSLPFNFLHMRPRAIYYTVCFPALLLAWVTLGPSLYEQAQYTRARANVEHKPIDMFDIAEKKYASVYSLYEALKAAEKSKKANLLIRYSEKLQLKIPNYRNSLYFNALGHFLNGELKLAQLNLSEELSRDNYHRPSLDLATVIALKQNDGTAFAHYLAQIVRLEGVRAGVFAKQLKIQAQFVSSADPISLHIKKDQVNMHISEGFYTYLQTLARNGLTNGQQPTDITLSLIRSINRHDFFAPRSLTGGLIPSTSQTYAKLAHAIGLERILNQKHAKYRTIILAGPRYQLRKEYHYYKTHHMQHIKEVSAIEKQLNHELKALNTTLKFTEYQARRQMLIAISGWLGNTLHLLDDAQSLN